MSNLKFRQALRGGPPEPTDQREFNGVRMPEINNALTVLEKALGSTHTEEEGRALHLLQLRFAAPMQVDPRTKRVKRASPKLTANDPPENIAATLQARARALRTAARRRIRNEILPDEEMAQLRRMRDEVRSMPRTTETQRLLRTILGCISLTENDIESAGPLEMDNTVAVPTNEGPIEINLDTGELREIEGEAIVERLVLHVNGRNRAFTGYAALVARELYEARNAYIGALQTNALAAASVFLNQFHAAAERRTNLDRRVDPQRGDLDDLWGQYFTEMMGTRLRQG